MSSRYRNKRRGAKWPKLNLPNEGIHTENGHLFHHETPQPLNDAHKQRLLECGIQLDSQDSFSPEEDERIRKNWCSFVRKYSLPFENAQDYDGSIRIQVL
ncbi:hypothetical protein KIN20_019491 [Parelaphostrongylus tenuis]|uniref:Uncharacterized protein n=1 Tax=Parelaphostrongylus tenuis TaxID=148309 RepID=A0AAD5MLD7_PARTN|nr:hypothetical protein KIN20_019491 [Parelaphostrongylus tenuis]